MEQELPDKHMLHIYYYRQKYMSSLRFVMKPNKYPKFCVGKLKQKSRFFALCVEFQKNR